MADEAQIIYEYINGSTIEFKTNDLKITYLRHNLNVTHRPDGKIYPDDPGLEQRTFSFTATITGANMNTLNTVQMAAITYDATYPRIQKIYFAGATTLTNIEVVLTSLVASDLGNGFWDVNITLTEYTDA